MNQSCVLCGNDWQSSAPSDSCMDKQEQKEHLEVQFPLSCLSPLSSCRTPHQVKDKEGNVVDVVPVKEAYYRQPYVTEDGEEKAKWVPVGFRCFVQSLHRENPVQV